MKVSNIHVYGLESALLNAGLPYEKGKPRIDTLIKLANSKSRSHSKFLRQIMIGFNVEAPAYWLTEFDTYRIGITRMSTSTMHTLLKKQLTYEDFGIKSNENFSSDKSTIDTYLASRIDLLIDSIELIKKYTHCANDIEKLIAIKKILPMSFKYASYITMNYEVLRTMYNDRINHRLPEWQEFLNSFESILYFNEFIKGEENE